MADHLLSLSALLLDNSMYFTPSGELEHDLALRHDEHSQTESEFVASLIRDYLRLDDKGQHGSWAIKNRRRQLMDYAAEGKWGFGALCSKCTRPAAGRGRYFRHLNTWRTPWRNPTLSAAWLPSAAKWPA